MKWRGLVLVLKDGIIVLVFKIKGWILGWMVIVFIFGIGVDWIRFLLIVILGDGFLVCLVSWFRIFFFDIWSWVVIGGILMSVDGNWFMLDFMFDSNFFNWFNIENKMSKY